MKLGPKSGRRYESIIILLSPVIWISGLSALAYQLVAAGAFLTGRGRFRYPTPMQYLILGYCAVYALSIMLAAAQGADLLRVLAALYNLSIWVMGALVFAVAGKPDDVALRKASRRVLLIVFIGTLIAYFLFAPQGSVRLNSLLGLVVNTEALPENLAANTNLHMTSADWSTLGIGSRVSIMAPYPTALGMLALMLLGLAAPADWSRGSLVRYLPYALYAAVIAFMCASRAAMGSVVMLVGLIVLFRVSRTMRSGNFKLLIVTLLALFAVAGGVVLRDQLAAVWDSINGARAESSSLRFELYLRSVTAAFEEHPFLGFGVKERTSVFSIPLGSHSTLFGAMYKTGLVGVTAISALFGYICFVCMRVGFFADSRYRAGLAAGCMAMIPLLVFEDIDAIPLVAYLFFISLAVMERGDMRQRDTSQQFSGG